ncbi:MAG: NosD domain-containing protein [Acidobacteriaceae bacterium]
MRPRDVSIPLVHKLGNASAITLALLTLIFGAADSATAATRCVNPAGTGGCYSSISAAVTAAAAGDTIFVAQGTYNEDVNINKPVSLIGQSKENTIIDATGLVNGIAISGTGSVTVSGFTVENAEAAGIWVTNSVNVTIYGNIVKLNDKSLSNRTCPILEHTPFEAGEAFDCGEGVFFSGVEHSTIANNLITMNAGGILITDDTGPSHHNLVTTNSVVRNTALDCGITLPSHSGAGVYNNTVSGNDSSYNGGPGVGIFAPGPGSKAYGNVVVNNRLRGNGLPGVTMHNHAAPGVGSVPPMAPPVMFDDNVIVGNDISANAEDDEDAATSGPTGINLYSVAHTKGTVIAQNTITQEALDVVINAPANGNIAAALVHLNNFPGQTVGVQNLGTARIDATENWWGCPSGPNHPGCSSTSGNAVNYTPWLTAPFQTQ